MSHMNMRKASLIAAVILSPLIALGQQSTAAAEAEQTLRARVTEFLQYHVEGNFRKAYDVIADDTKDDYFNSGKVQLKGFTIDKVVFNDNFTKATVTAMLSKTMNVIGQEFPATVPSTTTWKIENGKWVWTNDVKAVWTTPMDPPTGRRPEATTPASNDAGGDLPKVFDDKTLANAAQSILQQVGVDKKQVTLATNGLSEDRVVFHNGMPGSVQLELGVPDIPGFSAKVEQTFVRAGADVPVVFRYEPGDPAKRRAEPTTVELVVQPLNQNFTIQVNFAAASPATQK
jgi:hypothetical protein